MISHILIPIALICFILRLTLLSELRKWAGAAPFNILFLTHSILMIYQGCKTTNVRITTIGCLLFSLLAITRYVDLFDSLLMRSAVFFIIGAGIFIVGNFYSKTKRRIQESEDRS